VAALYHLLCRILVNANGRCHNASRLPLAPANLVNQNILDQAFGLRTNTFSPRFYLVQHPSQFSITRRHALQSLAVAGLAGAATAGQQVLAEEAPAVKSVGTEKPFKLCLNTSTVRGQEIGIAREIELAAKVGFDSLEPWVDQLTKYVDDGGSLADLKKRIDDLGLTVESSIAFTAWIVDDDAQRKQALEDTKRAMDLVAQIGAKRIAAPPVGATDVHDGNLAKIAGRYRALLEIGEQTGVVPELELWGFSKTLNRLGEVAYVAIEAAHPQACILPDVYHIYKGGSDPASLRLLNGAAISCLHVNDYPDLPRGKIVDADRVFPGDGVAPLAMILRTLHEIGFRGALSLEVFNREYWRRDPEEVLREGVEKMRVAVEGALRGK
jgi:sugar phosphate isomerase/epimerase